MIECNLFFSKENQFRPHMLQALSGFISLNRQNAISLKIYYNSKIRAPINNAFYCEINNKRVLYDVDDGTDNLSREVLDYLQKEKITLFKRAYDRQAYQNHSFIKPYGLNYNKRINSFVEQGILHYVIQGFLSAKCISPFLSLTEDWSMMNCPCAQTNKILFCTRLWDQKKLAHKLMN